MATRKESQIRLIMLCVVAALLVVAALYIKTHQARFRDSAGNPTSSTSPNPASPGNQNAGPAHDTASETTSTSTGSTAPTRPPASTTLAKPTGQLISNHSISLTGTAANHNEPNETSSCQTEPAIQCDIRLTSSDGKVVKYVGAKTTDASGGASFDWSAVERGLTPGTWKVEAVATKGSQTAVSAADTLTVQP